MSEYAFKCPDCGTEWDEPHACPQCFPATSSGSIKDLEQQLKEVENKCADLESQLGATKNRKLQLKLKIAELKYGVSEGCIVIGADNKRFKVARVDVMFDPPWLEGYPQKKDGNFGIAKRHMLGRWQLEKPSAPNLIPPSDREL